MKTKLQLPNARIVLLACLRIKRIATFSTTTLAVCMLMTITNGQDLAYYHSIESDVWDNKKFLPAITRINQTILDKSLTPSKVPLEFAYYKGVCHCSLNNNRKGINNFDWILYNFNLSTKALSFIKDQVNSCSKNPKPDVLDRLYHPGYSAVNDVKFSIEISGPELIGKGGAKPIDWNKPQQIKVGSAYLGEEPVGDKATISQETLQKRRVVNISEEEANDSLRHWLGTTFELPKKIRITEHFVVADYTYGMYGDKLEELERALSFLSKKYSLQIPPNKIWIYTVPDRGKMQRIAKALHGIDINRELLGYSLEHDLSIISRTPVFDIGTIKHELMHVLIYSNYTGMAPWLSEGIPAIYEVSRFQNDVLMGVPNWRHDILYNAIKYEYDIQLKKLVTLNWYDFNAHIGRNQYDNKRLAVNHALARYFCMYLDEKYDLPKIFKAFAEIDVDQIEGSLQDHAVLLLERILDKPMVEVQKDFVKWFQNN